MDFNDIFKRFFQSDSSDLERDNPMTFRSDDHPHNFPMDSHKSMDEVFRHFHGGMEQQMQEMQRQMEEMMKNFGVMEFSSPEFELPPTDNDPRNEMLKEREASPYPEQDSDAFIAPHVPPTRGFPSFGGFFGLPSIQPEVIPEERFDTDLDGKIDEKNVVDIFKNLHDKPASHDVHPRTANPHVFSSHKSVSVTTIRGADGKLEHKRTVRDSTGNEETYVTRSLGDQTHTVVTKTDDMGVKETIENYQNMDEGDLSRFNEQWHSNQGATSTDPRSTLVKPDAPHQSQKPSLFSKLFGLNWKDS